MLALLINPLLGQGISGNPLADLNIRQAAGIPTFGDMLVDVSNSAREFAASKAQATASLRAARQRFWQAYPSNPDLEAASAQLELLLRSKDLTYLSFGLGNGPLANPVIQQLTGGKIDGGIPPGARAAFQAWVAEVNRNLGFDGSSASLFRFSGEALADPNGIRAKIDQADAEYQAYVVRRKLEEFRMNRTMPPNIDPEVWRLALLAFEHSRQEDNPERGQAAHEDPYGDAFRAVDSGGGFPRQCEKQIKLTFGASTSPAACSCLHRLFAKKLRLKDQWHLEAEFSEAALLAASVSQVGLREEVAACLQ